MLKNFVVNKKNKTSTSIEIFFDFIVIAAVSLIFNGFILNSHSQPAHIKYFMIFNAGLITTYWYSYLFFRQRFEKDNPFFFVFTLIKFSTLMVMVIGLDLIVFRQNGLGFSAKTFDTKDSVYMEWIGMVLWAIGYLSSRFISFIEYLFCILANGKSPGIIKLIKGKATSRLLNSILASIHLTLLILDYPFPALTFTFMPLYLIIEFLGNVAFVTDKNLKNTPKISILYASQRYKKLTNLYIGSMFISGSIQFAYYFREASELYMISRILAVYFIGFLVWWFYYKYSHTLLIKQKAKNLISLALLNIFVTASLAIFGSALINSHNDLNSYYIMIAAPLALAVFLLCQNIYLNSLYDEDHITILDFKKESWICCIINIIILVTFAILSSTLNPQDVKTASLKIPIWTVYIVVSFVLINSIATPHLLKLKKIKNSNENKTPKL
ncbi:MAG: hypothetical protein HRT99_02840 [Mycoplasmatales bacterium]|nr:hypothetical protein [Mycoplasmatales bacterium]